MMQFFSGYEAQISLGLVILLFGMFVWEKYPAEVTASAGAALFIVLGFVPTDKAMSVFSNSAPLTIGAMFLLTGALVRTGLLERVAAVVLERSKKLPQLALAVFLLTALVASRICHDMVEPMSAIIQGLEMIKSGDGKPDPDAVSLLDHGVGKAWAKLEFFRFAMAGATAEGDSELEEGRAVAVVVQQGRKDRAAFDVGGVVRVQANEEDARRERIGPLPGALGE